MTADYSSQLTSAAAAASQIRSGDGVYVHSNAAAPLDLLSAMVARSAELKDVRIYKLITFGAAAYSQPEHIESFYVHSMFVGPNVREAVNAGRADYTPIFFSELPALFRSGDLNVDVCLLQVSPPDADGLVSLGVSCDVTLAAMERARLVIAEVNPNMPSTCGRSRIPLDKLDLLVEANHALPEVPPEESSDIEAQIGRNVAELVDDGATIQLGIGGIPNAVLKALSGKKDLGIHSEMISDGILPLVEAGVVTNKMKTVLPGKMAISFLFGTRKLYDFVDKNKLVEFHPTDYINDPFVIAQNYKMTAINSALQVDLTGQVCADSLGSYQYSGCGGQVDFVRGSVRSAGGKAIIALPATARGGTVSRICTTLAAGSGVVTSRADVRHVVTEYGVANLHGKNMKDRVKALLAIAAPQFRAQLEEEAAATFGWLSPQSRVKI